MGAPFRAVADDLSGAAEIAPLLAGTTPDGRIVGRTVLRLAPLDGPPLRSDVVVRDLDSRDDVGDLAEELRDVDFVKIDSLMRGRPADAIEALLRQGRRPVLTPAVPALGRTTVHGQILVHGRPLADGQLLALEQVRHGDVESRLAPSPVSRIPLEQVRGPRAELVGALHAAPTTTIVDAETDADLDAIVRASIADPSVVLVGAAGLAGAVGRHRRIALDEHDPVAMPAASELPGTPIDTRPTLVVVGTRSSGVRAQLDALRSAGVPVLELPHDLVLDERRWDDDPLFRTARAALRHGTLAIALPDGDAIRPERSRALADGLGRIAARLGRSAHLVLTGGETARRTLTRLGISELEPIRVLDHGCVVSVVADGRAVVTRPGSFGAIDSLLRAVELLTPSRHQPAITI